MTETAGRPVSARRAAMERARRSRRPSRLGEIAGTTAGPDRELPPDAGLSGLLARTWKQAVAAPDLTAALDILLTLDGHVPADIQLRALSLIEECAVKVLFGRSWRSNSLGSGLMTDLADDCVFQGEIGLTTGGRVAVRAPSQGLLADEEDLVDGVLRVPWSPHALTEFGQEVERARARFADCVSDCRAWLERAGEDGREELLERLQESALRTAPFVLYHGRRRYTNFRENNTLTGKTLWPGHPDCAFSSLQGVPLDLWSDSDAMVVVCLTLLVRSAGFGRIEEANGTQLTIDHVAQLLERTRLKYSRVRVGTPVKPAASHRVDDLNALAVALRERRQDIGVSVQLYREIHGALMHKIERIAGPRSHAARQREELLCTDLSERLPLGGETLERLQEALTAQHGFLSRPHGGFGTGLESVVHETVRASVRAFGADFAMSRGIRSLPRLIKALRAKDWPLIVGWELPEYFCCVVPTPEAREHFGGSARRLADAAWAMSARMQYNSWHFIAGNIAQSPGVAARDYFVPPTMPDIAFHSDQHHHGHVANKVRFSVRSPQPVRVDGRKFDGFVDLRLLRCAGTAFGEQDLVAAHRVSAFLAHATTLAAELAATGEDFEVTAFDSEWHGKSIAGDAAAVQVRPPEDSVSASGREHR